MKPLPLFLLGVWFGAGPAFAAPEPFVAVPADGTPAPIIITPDLVPEGWTFEEVRSQPLHKTQTDSLYATLNYLREAVTKMTGKEPEIRVGTADDATGVILTTRDSAPPEAKENAAIKKALAAERPDGIDAAEAYYGKSEKGRVLIVANRADGISAGIVALLESVGYEVLGMGPNWVHVPDFTGRDLVFNWEETSRPGLYNRLLAPTTGQDRGVGTLARVTLSHPPDETVYESYRRWRVGTRQLGQSMPRIRGGHALVRYHRPVIQAMHDQEKTEGFLFPKVIIGEESERPAADTSNEGVFWINRGEKGKLPRCFLSDGKEWNERDLLHRGAGASLDLTSELTRRVILDTLIERSEKAFAETPDKAFYFSTDPEDGSPQYARIREMVKNPEWYPAYLKERGKSFGPYRLHGFRGIDQPTERWDGNSPSDIVYAFNNWLLAEYDRYIDGLPPEQQVTATGQPKKSSVYCNLLSYNYHDVPPHFNLDPRIRIKIAGFPKNRGRGQWANLRSETDMAAAYRELLPQVPSVIYTIWSQAYFHDYSSGNIKGSMTAEEIALQVREYYEAGVRGVESETDFNFGKYGLRYYLLTKMFWNPELTPEALTALRDRWFQRAFGSASEEMRAYYDFMAPKPSLVNSPSTWGRAIRLLDAAGKKAIAAGDRVASQRIDEVKQFWYFYYLVESGQATKTSDALKEFLWKGQTSYMTAMVMVAKRVFDGRYRVPELVGDELATGPAHYTPEETAAWWEKILAYWPQEEVISFADTTLANGRRGSEVDLNDLVAIPQFAQAPEEKNYVAYNYQPGPLLNRQDARFYTIATREGEEIGFRMVWPEELPKRKPNSARDVAYGVSRWDAQAKEWRQEVDLTQTEVPATRVEREDGSAWFVAEGRYKAPAAGTYLVEVGPGAVASRLTSLDYDLQRETARGTGGQTYAIPLEGSTLTPRLWYFYLPKGTRHLHLESTSRGTITVELRKGLPGGEWSAGRRIQLRDWGVKRIALREGEDGSVAVLESKAMPYLYSVPMLSAKTPAALLIPRAVAEADGLLP